MNFIRRVLPWLGVAMIAALIWFLLPARNAPGSAHKELRVERPDKVRADRNPDRTAAATAPAPDPQITRLLEQSLQAFQQTKGADESSTILAELRDGIRSAANEQAAAAAIRGFLKTGVDAPTRLPFVVGPDGTLESAPTLRSALIDLLGSLDPETALTASREVMDRKSSPDEYAVALRNLAWSDLDGDLKEELSRRFGDMLGTRDWLARPSAGFLEALDAAVQISDAAAFDSLIQANREALSSDIPGLSRAAFIAMDRMVLRQPSLLVDAFHADPALTGLSPDQRASLLSRLDISDPVQRDVFSRYLSAPDHGPREMEYFSGLFPNGNHLHGNWLITGDEASGSIDGQQHTDRRTLDEIHRMAEEDAAGPAHDSMVRIRDRLAGIVGGAARKPTK